VSWFHLCWPWHSSKPLFPDKMAGKTITILSYIGFQDFLFKITLCPSVMQNLNLNSFEARYISLWPLGIFLEQSLSNNQISKSYLEKLPSQNRNWLWSLIFFRRNCHQDEFYQLKWDIFLSLVIDKSSSNRCLCFSLLALTYLKATLPRQNGIQDNINIALNFLPRLP
jgi:hypothetical protein